MKTQTENYPIKYQHAVIAYLLAVTSATFTFILPRTLFDIFDIFSGTGFESATTLTSLTKLQHLFSMTSTLFVIGWIFAFFAASIPFTVGIALARQFKIFNWLYFLVGGVLTAIALEPLFISIPNLGINVQPPEPSFWQKYLTAFPNFLASGIVAGVVCRLYFCRAA